VGSDQNIGRARVKSLSLSLCGPKTNVDGDIRIRAGGFVRQNTKETMGGQVLNCEFSEKLIIQDPWSSDTFERI
jgi:hypothetical protein